MSGARGSPARGAFACPASARWLPWALLVAMVVAAAILAARVDPGGRLPNSAAMKALLVAVAAVLGTRIALSFAELRLTVLVRERDLLLELRGRMASLTWDDIERLDWDPPFRYYSRWIPALVLVDRLDRRIRVPAVIADGERLLSDLLAAAGRPDLADWATAQRLAARLARSRWFTAAGYAVAAGAVIVAAIAPLR